jgi:hypothetical protein
MVYRKELEGHFDWLVLRCRTWKSECAIYVIGRRG